MLASNPNFFGTAVGSPFPLVFPISNDTAFEELDCVSYNPEQSLLEATIAVKRPTGYGGDLCRTGSREYIRFFLDYGSGWVDGGLTSVEVHDIPNGLDCFDDPLLPLHYSATVKIDPDQRWCHQPVLPLVRAILSWQVIPTDATFVPVWGNVVECHVQIKPRLPWVIDLINELNVKLPDHFLYASDLPLPGPGPVELTTAQLASLYADTGKGAKASAAVQHSVPAHRFAHADLANFASSAAVSPQMVGQQIDIWKAAGLDWLQAASAVLDINADVSYEELECLGLDNNLDRLVATFKIKRPTGYNGDLCKSGSTEYVAFWADWENDCHWTYLGTAKLAVHDIATTPKDGLCYAAVLPVDLTEQRRPCDSPHVARIRAVLSWNVAPSSVDPDALGTWGNRIDSHVQIATGPIIGGPTPVIGHIGGIPVAQIDPFVGLTQPAAHFALLGGSIPADPDAAGRPCPFAGRVAIQGPTFPGWKYRIQVRRVTDTTWSTVNNSFTVSDVNGTTWTPQIASGEYFTYLPFNLNTDNILAEWDTTGEDRWEVKIDILGVAGEQRHMVQIHSGQPETEINIDSLGGNCGKFPVGTMLKGKFVARDSYLARYSLGTLPFTGPIYPPNGNIQTATAPGDLWHLDTSGMKPCGYVVAVTATSRAIYNSSPVYTQSTATVGFCLEPA